MAGIKLDDNLSQSSDTLTLTEIITIKTIMSRILDHHDDFKQKFEKMDDKMSEMIDKTSEEKTARMEAIQQIKDELHGRINTILLSILGGAGLFVTGIIMWLVEGRSQ